VPDYGAGPGKEQQGDDEDEKNEDGEAAAKVDETESPKKQEPTHYKLQAMKWGLIPSWTKRNPDYGSMLKTINCRDDSLAENRGMWTNMKKRKRCIVICHGFYEWLKKNGGKEKIPHYIKRKDGQLMCFAGLWDCVKYEGENYSETVFLFFAIPQPVLIILKGSDEKQYTYTIITTDSNKQLKFLHDRMPVIFEPGSEKLRTWLDPQKYVWNRELQSLLIPFEGELEIYPVNKDVGKVGNNSPSFIIPIDSAENKSNIANFFGNQAKLAKSQQESKRNEQIKTEDISPKKKVNGGEETPKKEVKLKQETPEKGVKFEKDAEGDVENSESNAPLGVSPSEVKNGSLKREHDMTLDEDDTTESPVAHKAVKMAPGTSTPAKSPQKGGRKGRSATSNGTVPKASPSKAAQGSKKITSFFGKRG
jgi:putative SOS response-associated peptidase YedK